MRDKGLGRGRIRKGKRKDISHFGGWIDKLKGEVDIYGSRYLDLFRFKYGYVALLYWTVLEVEFKFIELRKMG